jgi:hypothetical protein
MPRDPDPADAAWETKIDRDAARARRQVPRDLLWVHDAVVERALAANADALVLTGSTARKARTGISDLDYHLVGPAVEVGDLPSDLDLHVVSRDEVKARLQEGDDFTQWSLRFGCVIFDSGVVRECIAAIETHELWPDVTRKAEQARKSLRTAQAMVDSGDRDAAVEQVRTALTLFARWRLLLAHEFPLSRAELPRQLAAIGNPEIANDLTLTITRYPTLRRLAAAVARASEELGTTNGAQVSRSRTRAA